MPAAVYTLSGNVVRAGWNYFLVEGDGSKGLHDPSFVTAVLNASPARTCRTDGRTESFRGFG